MKRFLRGTVLLAAAAVVGACGTEPDQVKGGTPDHITVEPGIVLIPQADSQSIKIRLEDVQGTALHDPISISNIGAGIHIRPDSAYRPIYTTGDSLVFNTNGTELRVWVSTTALVATSFDISAGGLTQTVKVIVTPTGFDATVAPASADIAAPVTVTAPTGLTFGPSSGIVDASGNTIAYITGYAADNSSVTVLPIPGQTLTAFTVTDVHPAYAPALSLTLKSTADLGLTTTVGAGQSGTDDIATAPEILAAPGVDRGFVDKGTFAGVDESGDMDGGVQYYKLVVPADGTYDFSVTYPGGKDMAIYYYDATGASLGAIADNGGTGETSESATDVDLTAGTYYIGVGYFDYGAQLPPEWIALTVHQH